MTFTQVMCSHKAFYKLNKKTYNFKIKDCEEQVSFNDKVDDNVQVTKKQLSKITTSDDSSLQALKQAKGARKSNSLSTEACSDSGPL